MKIPADFLLGAATAAYQIEGAASEDGRGPSIWDVFSRTPGKVFQGQTGDVACNHYHLYKEDIALMKELGLDSYRLSISWPRLFPTGKGRLNQAGMDFYERLLTELVDAGIQPMVTLYHWDLPQKLQEEGGWTNRDTAARFGEYADAVFGRLGNLIPRFVTLNEPWCSTVLGHVTGEHAPGLEDYNAALAASHHLLLAHGMAVQAFREAGLDNSQIGLTNILTYIYPKSDTADDRNAVIKVDSLLNRWFLDPVLRGTYPRLLQALGIYETVHPGDMELISLPIDFLGVNYYRSTVVSHNPDDELLGAAMEEFGTQRTDMGWGVDADGMYHVLTTLMEDYGPLPVYITENGAAFQDVVAGGRVRDEERITYLRNHLAQALRAKNDGVDVRGYFLWSLLDNFEWAYGYSKRFGLYYVDYETQERIQKDSARWYQQVIRQRALPEVDERRS